MNSWTRWVFQTLATAAAYLLAGRLALLMAIPPGYATGVWPAAGIALACVLLWGARVAPAIVLGSFLVNLWTSLEAGHPARSIALPASIGAGAALQALLGAFLTRRSVGSASPLAREKDVIAFVVLGGPVSCIVNAAWGPLSLVAAGAVPWSNLWFTSWTWWVGDTIGVMVFAPLVLLWAPRFAYPRARKLAVSIPLAIAFAAVTLLFVRASAWEANRINLDFQRRTDAAQHSLKRSMAAYLEILRFMRELCASARGIDRKEFHAFLSGALSRYGEIQGLSWNPRVPAAAREAFEQAARRDGVEGFRITDRDAQERLVTAARRPEHFPVFIMEPKPGNLPALGFDLASRPDRLEALERARDSGEPFATSRIRLAVNGSDRFGFLIVAPVYAGGGVPGSLEERRRLLRGFCVAVFRLGEMLEATLRGIDLRGVLLEIHDGPAGAPGHLLGTYPADSVATRAVLTKSVRLDAGGRAWTLRFSLLQDFLAAHRPLQAWSVMVGGLALAAFLGTFLLGMTARASEIEGLVVQRTGELRRTAEGLRAALEERELAEDARRRLTETLDRQVRQLKAANRELDAFTYSVSHDLRAPLRAIEGFCAILHEKSAAELDHEGRGLLDVVRRNAKKLAGLLDDLLEFSRIGRQALEPEDVDMSELARGVARELEAGGGRVRWETGELPRARGDRALLRQVFVNLLANALKFSRNRDPAVIRIEGRADGEEVVYSVRDNGAGFDMRYADKLFGVFQRLHSFDEFEGTGVGLAIVDRVIQLHGGRVWAEGEVDRGATFHFALPRGARAA